MAKKAKAAKKGKKPIKNKKTSKKYTMYKIEGDKITRERNCMRCGPGVCLMHSQGRYYCVKCHYSDFESKKENKVYKIPNSNRQPLERNRH